MTPAPPRPNRSVNRTVLREQLKEHLLERILDGEYQPGQRLVETQIAKEFGTSQAPVREALRDLEALRLVETEPFRGARVRPVSREELIEVYPVRAALEEVAARPATARLATDLGPLERELDGMRKAARDGDLHDLVRHDANFHRLIVEASGNRILIDLWSSLGIEARTTITAVAGALDPADLAEMHRPIFDAIAAGDAEAAAREMRSHIEYFGELLRREGHLGTNTPASSPSPAP
jgi:DNA-binding GntR family transcriptional regulator